jgi:hypothetical protein
MSEANTDHGALEEPSERQDRSARAARTLLLRAAALLIGALIVDSIAAAFHASPPTGDANDLAATFPGIAESQTWPAAHFLQFAASLIFAAGVVVLYRAAAADSTRPSLLLDWLGPAVTVAAAAVGSVQYAIDGVALKHAVDAWASAGPGEKDAAFRTAELARWLEWAATSYATLLLGTALVLLGLVVARSRVLPTWLGVLIAAPGVVNLVSGVIVGSQGFSATLVAVSAPTVVLLPVAAVAVGVVGWRTGTPEA